MLCAVFRQITLCTEAKWLLTGEGLLASLCRAYAECSTLSPTAESGFNRKQRAFLYPAFYTFVLWMKCDI